MLYGSKLHIPPTNYHLLAAKQQPYQKRKVLRHDRKSNGSRQKKKGGKSTVESDESAEIPDRRETSDIPGLPSRVLAAVA